MPDPITPAASAGHTIDLEPITITGTLRKPEPPAPVPYADIALQCFDEVASGASVLLSASKLEPHVAIVALVGSGAAIGACVASAIVQSEEAASIRRAVQDCVDAGGTPIGLVEHTLNCSGVE